MEFSPDEVDRAIDKAVDDEIKLMADAGLTTAVQVSPVDSGKFKGSWEVGVNGAAPAPPGQGVDPGGAATLARGRAQIRSYKRVGVVIESDLPYSDRIDNGWSLQAPGGVSYLAEIAAVSVPSEDKDL